jgi:hypothetical protein
VAAPTPVLHGILQPFLHKPVRFAAIAVVAEQNLRQFLFIIPFVCHRKKTLYPFIGQGKDQMANGIWQMALALVG